jgi:acyl transferase domain-containing protein
MKAAHARAGLNVADTYYFECHGTGTPEGDGKETRAVSMVAKDSRPPGEPVLIGSVKPNTGHSEAASSISTIMKTVLGLEAGVIPPTAGVTKLSTRIPWDELNLKPVLQPTKWPSDFRRISVNAFGYGGTNSCAIFEHYTKPKTYKHAKSLMPTNSTSRKSSTRPHLLTFSAHDEATLKLNIQAHSKLQTFPDILDLSYTLATRRSKLTTRAYAIARQDTIKTDILSSLRSIKQKSGAPVIAFAFTGQGAQWPQMGACLFETYPTFAKTIDELDHALATAPNPPFWKIKDCLLAPAENSHIHKAEISQPLCTAVQIALVDLLNKWNVTPTATIGHSSGEIAAAYAAGYISAQDAIRIAYYRGKIVASLESSGAMLAVGLGAAEVMPDIEKYNGRVVAACHNSPESVTLSGDADAIDELQHMYEERNVFNREVKTGGRAYHSHHMTEPAREYRKVLSGLLAKQINDPWRRLHCKMVSTVYAQLMDDSHVEASYWADNLSQPVLFDEGLASMLTRHAPNVNLIVEIGPHPALAGPIKQVVTKSKSSVSYVATLKRGMDDTEQILKTVGELWAADSSIDMSIATGIETLLDNGTIGNTKGSLVVDLPRYQWNYSKRYYAESRDSYEHRNCKHPRHDILGRRVAGISLTEPQWRNTLRLQDVPWLKHHTVCNIEFSILRALLMIHSLVVK